MGHSVVIEVGRGRESLPADGTFVRLLTAVNASVRVERAGRGETFAAHVADVRLFTCKTTTKKGETERNK